MSLGFDRSRLENSDLRWLWRIGCVVAYLGLLFACERLPVSSPDVRVRSEYSIVASSAEPRLVYSRSGGGALHVLELSTLVKTKLRDGQRRRSYYGPGLAFPDDRAFLDCEGQLLLIDRVTGSARQLTDYPSLRLRSGPTHYPDLAYPRFVLAADGKSAFYVEENNIGEPDRLRQVTADGDVDTVLEIPVDRAHSLCICAHTETLYISTWNTVTSWSFAGEKLTSVQLEGEVGDLACSAWGNLVVVERLVNFDASDLSRGQNGAWLLNSELAPVAEITFGGEFAVAPDGNTVAFLRGSSHLYLAERGQEWAIDNPLVFVEPKDGPPKNTLYWAPPAWSRDSRWLATYLTSGTEAHSIEVFVDCFRRETIARSGSAKYYSWD